MAIAQYVVEGTRSISAAIRAVERAQHLNEPIRVPYVRHLEETK